MMGLQKLKEVKSDDKTTEKRWRALETVGQSLLAKYKISSL
jgi:hypothetical protein